MKRIVTVIIATLLCIACMGITVYAGTDTNADSGSTKTGDKLQGGPSSQKTGVYVTVSTAPNDNSPSHAIGNGIIFKTKGGQNIPSFDVDSQSKISGSHQTLKAEAPWPFPAFKAGSNPVGYGKTICEWCKNTKNPTTGQSWASTIVLKCGVTNAQQSELLAKGNSLYLNFEPIMFCNNFSNTKNSKGAIIVGLVSGIAEKIPEGKTYISSVTKSGFPKSFMYETNKNWQGISGVTAPAGLISNADMKNKKLGYGICSIKLNQGQQVVIVCEDASGKCETEYLSANNTWNIENPYKGCNFVEATFSKKKTDLTDPHATYSAVCSSGQPNRSVGTGNQTFNVAQGEEALFIHYKGTLTEEMPILSEADLKAWECGVIMPKYAAQREDGADVDNSYTLKDHIEEVIEKVKGFREECPDNGSHCEHVQCTGHAVIDRVTCKGSEDWQSQKYGISANLGAFPNAIWNLYRPEVSTTKWDTFAKALGNTERWTIDEEVDPQFSYFLTRSHLEDVSVSPDREGIGATAKAYNIAPQYTWEQKYTGKEGVAQKGNSTATHDVEDYDYQYTAYGYDLKIYYHFEHDEKSHEEGEQVPNADGIGTHYEVTHSCHHSAHSWGNEVYEESTYSPSEWNGSTGGHKEDKFKTKGMPSGKNTNAGKVVEVKTGETLKGRFAKSGEEFEYKAVKAQLVGSDFQGTTFSIYPEVAMSIWISGSADKYTNPTEKLVYVMGEYKRNYTPPIAHSFKTKIESGEMKGIGSLASASTGAATKGVNAYDLGITAMGTTFEVATQTRYEMDIYTVGCNVTDSEANSEWGNQQTDVAGSHEEYVSSVINGMQQELIMKMDSSKFDKPIYYTLLSTEGHLKRTDEHKETEVFFHSGKYDQEGTVQGWCNTMWGLGADAYEEALQYTSNKILNTMFVSCTDGVEDNASLPYNPNPHVGTAMNGILQAHGSHWYDEESKNKMKVEYYHTHIVFGYMTADDKVDYNLLEQSGYSRLINRNDNIHVSFYTRLANDLDYTSADGYTWGDLTGTYSIDHMIGTDFSVINQTTAQMKK